MNKYLCFLEDILGMIDRDIIKMNMAGVDISPALELRKELIEVVEKERVKDDGESEPFP